MIKRLPSYYRKSKVVKDLYAVIKKVLDKVSKRISIEDLRLFITTTDLFSLHEKDVGLSGINADYETKRSRVLARIQGNNLLTKSEFESLIEIYDKSGCTITEDYPNYTVTILFSGMTGVPYNIEQIKAAIEEVKPAHIKIEYDFQYNTWGDVKKKFKAWKDTKELMWDDVRKYDGRNNN